MGTSVTVELNRNFECDLLPWHPVPAYLTLWSMVLVMTAALQVFPVELGMPSAFRVLAMSSGVFPWRAMCKGIVEAHGGRIWAESDGLGLGSRFAFTLPAAETARPARPASHSGGRVPQRVRVLTVDDDPQTLRYVRDVLSEAGYVPQVTGDPEAVGRLIREEKPHLMLPGTDGVELMEIVPELAEVPVIFLSAYGRDQVIARALEAGADDYIVKPFSPTELVARIQTVRRRRAPVGPGGPRWKGRRRRSPACWGT